MKNLQEYIASTFCFNIFSFEELDEMSNLSFDDLVDRTAERNYHLAKIMVQSVYGHQMRKFEGKTDGSTNKFYDNLRGTLFGHRVKKD